MNSIVIEKIYLMSPLQFAWLYLPLFWLIHPNIVLIYEIKVNVMLNLPVPQLWHELH